MIQDPSLQDVQDILRVQLETTLDSLDFNFKIEYLDNSNIR